MEKIKPTRQLMPGESLPASNYASKDDVSAAATMASCAKQTADTANDRVTALDSSLQNNVTTSHLAVDLADVTTANITTGNLSTLNANCGNLDNLTVACAASLNCAHMNCGSIDNLTTCNITMNTINSECGVIDNLSVCSLDVPSLETCGNLKGAKVIGNCVETNNIKVNNCSCVNILNGNTATFTSANIGNITSNCLCFTCGRTNNLCAGILCNSTRNHYSFYRLDSSLWVRIDSKNGFVALARDGSATSWSVYVSNSSNTPVIQITKGEDPNDASIDQVWTDSENGYVYVKWTNPIRGIINYVMDTYNGAGITWIDDDGPDTSLATMKKYDIVEQKQVVIDGTLISKGIEFEDIEFTKVFINNEITSNCDNIVMDKPLTVCGNLSVTGNIIGTIENAQCLCGCTLSEVLCDAREPILELIPPQATCSNQLADKCFVNSSISTNTANFVGTYDDVACLPTVGVTNNDYAFITSCDTCTGTITYSRYKYVASTATWLCEYSLNTSGFTSDQLEAINSGITCTLVGKITDVHNCTIQINQNGTCVGSFTLNQNTNQCIDINGGGIAVCQGNYTNCFNVLGSSCGTNKECVFSNTSIKMQPSTGTLFATCFSGTATNATCFNGCTYECACSDILSNTYKKCTSLPACSTVPIPLISDYCVMLPSTSDTWSTTYYYCKDNRCCDKLTVANICANIIDVGTINATTLCGNATSASLVCMRSCNQNINYPIAIWTGSTANQTCALAKSGNSVAPFTWNPTCRHFCLGNTATGVGEIHCATLCGTASRSVQIKRNASTENQDLHLAMLSGCDTNSCSDVYVSNCCPLTYNPSTGLLCAECIQATCFVGSITSAICATCSDCATCVCVSSIATNTNIPLVGASNGYKTLCTSLCMPTVNACTGAITLYPSSCVTCGKVTARRYVINGFCYIQACWASTVECDLQKALKCTLPGTWWCNNHCYAPVTGWIRASNGNVCVYTLLHVDCDSKYSFRDYVGCWTQVCGTSTTQWNDPGAIVLGPIWW